MSITYRPLTVPAKPNIIAAVWVACVLCLVIQLCMGTRPDVAVLDMACISVGLGSVAYCGPSHGGGILVLFYVLCNVIVALFLKTALRQTLQSHLFGPEGAYLVELATILALAAALILVRKLNIGRPVFEPEWNTHKLRIICWLSALLGIAGWVSTHAYGSSGHVSNGFSTFRDFLFLAIICKTAILIIQKKSRLLFDGELLVLLVIAMGFGFLRNSKTYTTLPVISYVASIFFFQGRLSISRTVIMGAIGGFFLAVVEPLIHVLRLLGQAGLSVSERLALIGQEIAQMLAGSGNFAALRSEAASLYSNGYYNYFENTAPWMLIAGRYACVQQIDPVVAKIHLTGLVHLPVLSVALESVLPHVLDQTKATLTLAYYILLKMGFITIFGGTAPTLPMAGELYAAYGMPGVLVISTIVFVAYLLVLKKLCWNVQGNVFAIFFVVHFIFVHPGECELEQYLNETLRQLPTYALIILSMRYVASKSKIPKAYRSVQSGMLQ